MSQQKTRSTRTKSTACWVDNMPSTTALKHDKFAYYSSGGPLFLPTSKRNTISPQLSYLRPGTPTAAFPPSYVYFHRHMKKDLSCYGCISNPPTKSSNACDSSSIRNRQIRPKSTGPILPPAPGSLFGSYEHSNKTKTTEVSEYHHPPTNISYHHPYSYFDPSGQTVIGDPCVVRERSHLQMLGHHSTPQSYYEVMPHLRHNGLREMKAPRHQGKKTRELFDRAAKKVDHTYRDFSGVPPSMEDLERYENKMQEYSRRKKGTTDTSSADLKSSQDDPLSSSSSRPSGTSKADAVYSRRGRGNRASRNGESRFIGFMGTNFPARLHDLLSHEEDVSDIITWLPHGRSWIVRDKKAFLKKVAASHFQITKFESFTRQVNGWGFKRITQGPDANSYYHELFLRGMPHLIQWMKRASSSSSTTHGKRRLRADPDEEPNFYEISAQYPIPDYYGSKDTDKPVSLLRGTPTAAVDLDVGKVHHDQNAKLKECSPQHTTLMADPTEIKADSSTASHSSKSTGLEQEQEPAHDSTEFKDHLDEQTTTNIIEHLQHQENNAAADDEKVQFVDLEYDRHREFYQIPMLSPMYLTSPKIDDRPNLTKDSQELQDMTSDEFWIKNNVPSRPDPRPVMRRKAANEVEDADMYDVVTPAVSSEENSEGCADALLPTTNQWQSICDLLLQDEFFDDSHKSQHSSINTTCTQNHAHHQQHNDYNVHPDDLDQQGKKKMRALVPSVVDEAGNDQPPHSTTFLENPCASGGAGQQDFIFPHSLLYHAAHQHDGPQQLLLANCGPKLAYEHDLCSFHGKCCHGYDASNKRYEEEAAKNVSMTFHTTKPSQNLPNKNRRSNLK